MKIVNAERRIVDKLTDECTENIEEVKLAKITPMNYIQWNYILPKMKMKINIVPAKYILY